MSSNQGQQKRLVVFDSDDSSASDGEGNAESLAQEMAAAAERERRKNPHAETGRAKAPRTHPLAPAAAAAAVAAPTHVASSAPAPHKTKKKMDLFSSSDDEDEDSGVSHHSSAPEAVVETQMKMKSGTSSAASKMAHVHGLSFRAVKRSGESNPADAKKRLDDDDNDAEEDDDDDDGEDDGANMLRINKAFATRYEEQKRKQELHTLAEKYKGKLGKAAAIGMQDGSDNEDEGDDEDDAEEDDDAVLLTRENGLSFAKALLAVRKATVPLPTKFANAGSSSAVAAAAAPALLPKDELLKDRFFPPAADQIEANTQVFERYVERKRQGVNQRFTLADEYARAVRATADSEDAVVDSAEGGSERDGLRKLRPQNAAEAQLRAAFLRDVEDSANTFEVVKGSKSNKTEADGEDSDDVDEDEEGESRQSQAAREEERRLLEAAFALGASSSSSKRAPAAGAEGGEGEGEGEGPSGAADGDAFLRDFFIQELWRPGTSAPKKQKRTKKTSGAAAEGVEDEDEEEEDDGTGGSYYDRLAQLAREEEDEAFFNDAEVWEREYQEKKYRHQEAEEAEANGGADAAHVQTFPRPIGEAAVGLLRKPDTARKDARQRRRERAEAAHAQQLEELKRLKHLKRREIEDQRALIASVAGLTVGRRGGGAGDVDVRGAFADGDAEEEAELAKLKAVWSDKDLDAPFDPAEFDRKMAQLFNEDYYDERNVDEDEVAYFDEELDKEGAEEADEDEAIKSGAAPALFAAESLEDAQALLPKSRSSNNKANKKKSSGGGGTGEKFFDDDAFGPADGSGDAVTLLYPSEALQELEKERQHVNELLAASQQQSGGGDAAKADSDADLLAQLQASLKKKEEEYYQLHRDAAAESAGASLPFRYREVEPEDFTLSVEEILALDDRQLNMIAPMNCYAAYLDKDSNERDRRRIERRRQKGMREVASDRTSRRYGDVGSTAVLNPAEMNEEEGAAIAENLAKRLRDEGEDPEAPLAVPHASAAAARPHRGGAFRGPRTESGRGGSSSSSGGGRGGGGRGGFRGRGGAAPSSAQPFRGRGGGARGGSAGGFRGGRGAPRDGGGGGGGRGGGLRRGY